MFQKDTIVILVIMIMIELGIIFSLPAHATIKTNTQIQELNLATEMLHNAPSYANLRNWHAHAEEAGVIPLGLDSLGSLQYYSDNYQQIQIEYPDAASVSIKANNLHTTQIAPET